jgi:hypothetical protein
MRRCQVSALQAALQAHRSLLRGQEELLPLLEYATLVDVAYRMLEHERRRTARWLERRDRKRAAA